MTVKTIYILAHGVNVLTVGSNLKVCYQAMKHFCPYTDKDMMISYSQLTRIMKKRNIFQLHTQFNGQMVISRSQITSVFKV